jgi:hypothetical protein
MPTTRADLEATLAVHDPEALRLILHASGVDPRGATTAHELAARIADALWWHYSTPLGYLTERASFEDIVGHVAGRLQVSHALDEDAGVWEQTEQLTLALVHSLPDDGISVDDLDPALQARLRPAWGPALGFGTGASSSFAARWGSSKVLALLKSPIGRLLPLLPYVGPWVGVIRTGASAIHVVTGPLGVALGVLTLNSSLGSNYRRLVPLVLGVGALGPRAVDDALVVGDDDAAPEPTTIEE